MRKYSIMTAVIPLPIQVELQSVQPMSITVILPDNAIPLQVEYRPSIANFPASCALHYLVPITDEGIPLCEICNERPAEFEGVICFQCKKEQDDLDIKEEMEVRAQEVVEERHKGEQCWIQPGILCQEDCCKDCQTFLDWCGKYGIKISE